MNLFYRIFYRGFLKYHQQQCKPRQELTYAFTDSEGNKYHTFPSKDKMPTVRYNYLLKMMGYYECKLSPKVFDHLKYAIVDLLNEAIGADDIKQRNQKMSQAVQLTNEMGRREEMCIPHTIFLEFCAIFAIRSDEDPLALNTQIHDEKVQQFALDIEKGYDFFFELPSLQKYLNLSRQSSAELKVLFARSKVREEQMEQLIYHYLSAPTLKRSAPITES